VALNPKTPRSRRQARQLSLTAAAENLQARLDRLGGQAPDVGEAWQRDVWDLYDKVPELRTAARLTGEAMSQCRLVLARVSPNGEPIPLKDDEEHPGKALLQGFAGGAGGQAELLDAIGVALTVPGETILVGALDPREALKDDFLRIQAYSSEQVRQVNQTVTIRRDESTRSDRQIDLVRRVPTEDGEGVDTQTAAAIRIWRPHPRFSWQADSAARAALGVLQEIAMYDDHILATGVSRLAGAGMVGIPEGMTLPGVAAEDEDPDGETDPFMQLLMQIMSLAIRDRKSAAALVPILLRGAPDDIAAIKHITFSTPFDEKVADLRERAIGRLGSAVDMPSEILTGLGDTQGWIGSLITDDWKKSRLQTLMGLAVGSITVGWFYPALIATGNGEVGSDVIVWFDDSSVRTRENTGPEAQGAFDRGAIDGAAYRKSLGYDDGDAIDWQDPAQVREAAASLLFKAPALAPLLMPLLGFTFTQEQLDATAALSEATKGGLPMGAPGTADPSQTPPETGSATQPQPRTEPATAMRAFRSVPR
jgi:hypothetical protein